ncbi:MAG: SDR family NAD(P)-dependent oxidoreductase [Microbacterium sp.]
MQTALITGGTSGLGAGFAKLLASEGHDLVIVARDETRLAETAASLSQTYGISVETISADLSQRDDVARVAERLESTDAPIDILINNAGFGIHSPLTGADTSEHERAIDVMVRAVLLLGGAAGRAMSARGRGIILNVSSVAGYIRMGSYSSVKAFTTAYSESLSVELRGTGVTVTTLTPGWVRTEFHQRAGISSKSVPGFLWLDSDAVVNSAWRDATRGKAISNPTARFKVLAWFCRHLPQATVRWISGKISGSRRKHIAASTDKKE